MRIHFTRADLARTHLADGPDPMWELVTSLQILQSRYGQAVFGPWRRRTADRLHRAALAGVVRGQLFPVAPHASYFPDLLTPPEAALGVDEGIEAVVATPRHRLRKEIGRLPGSPGAGSWLVDLASATATAMAALGRALREYHRHAIAPEWDVARVSVDLDLAGRRRAVRDGGVPGLLESFRPMMRWRHPVLELADHPSDRDLHLDGRGLLLVPSYFCWVHPLTIFDPDLPQVVVYPVHHDPAPGGDPGSHALARLLGTRRAAVLAAIEGGSTTSELARRLRISTPTTSHNVGVLRAAGLVTSRRAANTVLHTLSPLGEALLRRHR